MHILLKPPCIPDNIFHFLNTNLYYDFHHGLNTSALHVYEINTFSINLNIG